MGNIDDNDEKIRVGSLVMILRFIFFWGIESQILKENQVYTVQGNGDSILDKDFLEEVCFNLAEFLKQGDNRSCNHSIYIILEIFMLIGKTSSYLQEEENLDLYIHLLQNNTEPSVRGKCTKFLFELGSIGIQSILEVIHLDETIKKDLIIHLINSPGVIETIIIPSILNKFHSANPASHTKAVAALSRLGCLGSRNESIPVLLDLLKHSTLNKNLICGALRSFGDQGLRALIETVCVGLYDDN